MSHIILLFVFIFGIVVHASLGKLLTCPIFVSLQIHFKAQNFDTNKLMVGGKSEKILTTEAKGKNLEI